ncbi:hypothetical protein ACUXAV_002266 [Cupriavidus metallidurans]|jgi:hypothetical protein|nr:hypothetical protein [Cupriavidus metallidurans]AVA35580.1 hypothetical protein C3Z06_19535 [Cupriavidus metallidurans]MDE4921546.1 hypothetical protein [Cupriavidus metallidurans]QGS32446.1 hypothetical protein FOB83_26815 [Cupriavidus metallidurans]
MTKTASTDPVAQSLLAWVTAVKHGLPPRDVSTSRLDGMRLEDLVLRLLDLDIEQAARLDVLADSGSPIERSPIRFYETLQQATP